MNMIDQIALERLEELAAGAEPHGAEFGICSDINKEFRNHERDWCGYGYCAAIFKAMGLHEDWPLGRYTEGWEESFAVRLGDEPVWEGPQRLSRYALCGLMADYIKEHRA